MNTDLNPIRAFHMLPKSGCLTHGDGRRVVKGGVLSVEGELELCRRGLHGCRDILDVLWYTSRPAPGAIDGRPVLCQVNIWGDVQEAKEEGIICGRYREVLEMKNISAELREFSYLCVERMLLLERESGREPDVKLWDAIVTQLAWVRGRATYWEKCGQK